MTPDPRIDAYIERAQPFARPILQHIRQRVHVAAPHAVETLKWGAPAFTVNGKILLMTAAFKAHAVVNFWRGQDLREEEPSKEAMGQFGKLKSVADLPRDEDLDVLIRRAAELCSASPGPRTVKHEPKPPAQMRPEFAQALDMVPAAKTTFESFPPSCRREYVDWVADAKRDETRAKRIATAVEWLCQGKKRHWKYEKC